MSKEFPMVPLEKILKHRNEFITIDELASYKRCRVQLHAQGIVQRDVVQGAEIKTKKQQICRAGDFLVAEIDAKVGGFGVVPEDLDGAIVSSHYFLFNIDNFTVDKNYLDFFSRTRPFLEQVQAQGSTNYAAIRPKDVLNYAIPLPPLEEQRRIVARIEELATKIEEARGLRREAVEETETIILSSLSRLFDYNTSKELPANWIFHPLRELLSDEREGITTGPFGTLLQRSDIRFEGIPVLGIANVQKNGILPRFSDYISLEKAQTLSHYKLEVNDIVIARSGTVGRSCIFPKGISPNPIMSTNLIRLRLNTKVFLPELLCRLLNGSSFIERHKEVECRGSTRDFFTQRILLKLPVPTPPLPEQRRIVAYLDDLQARVDALKQLQAQTAAELDAMLPSVLDKAFRGEL